MNDAGMALVGFLIGGFFVLALSIYHRDKGRYECEQKLPRAEKCVQQWVPQLIKGGA